MPEACALLRVCRDLVREMIKDGRLKGSKVGRDWRILASSVAELLGITPAP
jgi:excisionase family DNA binding protein